jgi:hypothetical protein
MPLKALIMVESPLVGREAWPFLQILYRGVLSSNARRTTSWPSKQDAMKWFTTHFPWKAFDPAVLQIIEVRSHEVRLARCFLFTQDSYFTPDSGNPGFITTKTTLEQETACFVDNGTQLDSFSYLLTVLDVLPTHVISGSHNDIWYVTGYCQLVASFTVSQAARDGCSDRQEYRRCARPTSNRDRDQRSWPLCEVALAFRCCC